MFHSTESKKMIFDEDNSPREEDDKTISEYFNWEKDGEDGAEGGDTYSLYGLRPRPFQDSELNINYEEVGSGVIAKGIYEAFMPYQKFMQILLRYPCGSSTENGIFQFSFNGAKPYAIGFCITSIIVFIISILSIINGVGMLLDSPVITATVNGRSPETLQLEEHFLYRRNVIPCIIIITSLVHATIGNICFFYKRHFACTLLAFWTEAAEITKIDVAAGVYNSMWWTMCIYGSFLVLFSILCSIQFAPVSTGGPAVLTVLTLRIFIPHIHAVDYFYIIRGVFAFVFLYIMISAKSYVFLFLYYTKLLKNAFVTWNHRLDLVLHGGGGSLSRAEKMVNRLGFDQLFRDYICLLDLLAGVDTLFANIIESYFATQMFSVLFEAFYCIRSVTATKTEFTGVRSLDAVIMFLYLTQTLWVFFIVSNAAADVGEEAMDGLEIMRRKGMMGKKTDEELYFMLSLYTSYSGHYEPSVVGGNYVVMNKAFIVGIVGTVLSYFVILMQFNPPLTLTSPKDLGARIDSAHLLRTAEGTRLFGMDPENISIAVIALGPP